MHSQLEIRLLRRMFAEQTSSAIHLISKPHTASTQIHEARKHLKRARATLRLLRSGLRSSSYRRADRTLRDAAHLLSAARDADVLIRLLDALALLPEANDAESSLSVLRKRLLEQHETAETKFEQPRARSVAMLRDAIDQSRAWIPMSDASNVIVAGLQRTYAKSRKAYRAAMHDVDDETLHTWRKHVKYSRYQLESLAGLTPPQMDKRAQRLAKLGHILGQDHDLALLQAVARRMTRSTPGLRPKSLDALIAPRRSKLQADAFTMGASLYKGRAKQFAARMSGGGHPSRQTRRFTAAR